MTNTFELMFRGFVTDFGGDVVPEDPNAKTADYWFKAFNVIAELNP